MHDSVVIGGGLRLLIAFSRDLESISYGDFQTNTKYYLHIPNHIINFLLNQIYEHHIKTSYLLASLLAVYYCKFGINFNFNDMLFRPDVYVYKVTVISTERRKAY